MQSMHGTHDTKLLDKSIRLDHTSRASEPDTNKTNCYNMTLRQGRLETPSDICNARERIDINFP